MTHTKPRAFQDTKNLMMVATHPEPFRTQVSLSNGHVEPHINFLMMHPLCGKSLYDDSVTSF